MKSKYKIVVVDDSNLVRSIISDLISQEKDLEVVATGKTGMDCIELEKTLKPDMIILDVEMPVMDGLTALSELKKSKRSTPVLMLSVLTQHGAEATFKALELGAIDFVPKPSSSNHFNPKDIGALLVGKIRGYFENRTNPANAKLASPVAITTARKSKTKPVRAIGIGTSTGGPRALQVVIEAIPSNFTLPIFVVQHMPIGFTKPFAERLNSLCKIRVKEAEQGEVVQNGTVYIAPADFQMKFTSNLGSIRIELESSDLVNGHRPSIESMFESLRTAYEPNSLVAVIMTGMGKDGSAAIKSIRDGGGYTIAQDEATSVVFGMNRAAIELGGIDSTLPLEGIMNKVLEVVQERGF